MRNRAQKRVLFTLSGIAKTVAYALRIRKANRVDRRVDEAIEMVGLTPLAKQHVSTLLGGDLQQVALARAMVIEPQVLLLDEPTANLDPGNLALIENLVVDLNRSRATTVVLITHNTFQVRRLAHRTLLP